MFNIVNLLLNLTQSRKSLQYKVRRYLFTNIKVSKFEMNFKEEIVPSDTTFKKTKAWNTSKLTNPKIYKCDLCEKEFLRMESHKYHQKVHSEERTYECDACNMKFKFKRDLRNHLQIHNRVKSFDCQTCKKKFYTKTNLKRHEMIHSEEKPFECSTCGKTFNDANTMKEHVDTHPNNNK